MQKNGTQQRDPIFCVVNPAHSSHNYYITGRGRFVKLGQLNLMGTNSYSIFRMIRTFLQEK